MSRGDRTRHDRGRGASGHGAAGRGAADAASRASGETRHQERDTDAIRVGTRGSALALTQTGMVAKRLGAHELVEITSHGDVTRASLSTIGGQGVFAGALRQALLDGEVDVIVHSLKDLPVAPAPGIELAAITKREDPRDALCARHGLTLDKLPEGAKVGTGSPRRRAQLLARRPDLEILDIRGNIDTRLGRVTGEGADLDAVVLAYAGLRRLDRAHLATEVLELIDFPNAPGQGALAIEVRADDERSKRIARRANHIQSAACVTAEREVLAGLGAGCAAPIAANAEIEDGMLFLTATVYAVDGTRRVTASHAYTLDSMHAPELEAAASDVAARCVQELLDGGAAEVAPLGDNTVRRG